MKKVSGFFVVVFVIAVSIFPINTASAQSGFYFTVFGGYTFSPSTSLQYDDYYYNYNYHYERDIDIKETWAVGAKFGYTPPPLKFMSFELEYFYLNPDLDRTELTSVGADFISLEGDAKFHNFMFNAILKYPEGRFHPYIGGGLGLSYMDVSLSTAAPTRSGDVYYGRSVSNSDTVFAWQLLAGLEIDLTNNLSLDFGYRYFGTEPGSDDHDNYDYENYNTHLDYKTSMVTLGFKFKF